MPLSAEGNTWILVLTNHFTRWADALAIPETSAPTIAWALNQKVFCYVEFPEQIHTEQGTQFQSLPDMGGEPEPDYPISPAREWSHGKEQSNVG